MKKETLTQILELTSEIINSYKYKLIKIAADGDPTILDNKRHIDNFLTQSDLELNELYLQGFKSILTDFVFVSEETEPEVIGNANELKYMIIVDPLDTTELAVRALNGYTQFIIYDLIKQKPLVAVVGDFFHEIELYIAENLNGASNAYFKTRNNSIHKLKPSKVNKIEDSLITNFFMKPKNRFADLKLQESLFKELEKNVRKGRIGCDFGSIGFCHVAASFTDAYIEFSKGFYLWDLLPGQFILNCAGGIVLDSEGKELSISLPFKDPLEIKKILNSRTKFVAASNSVLGFQLVNTIF